MAIVKHSPRISRLDGHVSPEGTRVSISNDVSDLRIESSGLSEVDSGMGSDGCYDSSELGEPGTELCQLWDQSCRVPIELYDPSDLGSVLSVETWNSCLSEEEQFALAAYLPDMDQENFSRTLTELFSGSNFHFGSPLSVFFHRLKGGQLSPSVALYSRGLNFFQRRQHYFFLRKYHDDMVGRLLGVRDALESCEGYGIKERLRHLKTLRSRPQKPQQLESDVFAETDSDDAGSSESFRNKRSRITRQAPLKFEREISKGIIKISAPKEKARTPTPQLNRAELGTARTSDYQRRGGGDDHDDYLVEPSDGMGVHGNWNAAHKNTVGRDSLLKPRKKQELLIRDEIGKQTGFGSEDHAQFPNSLKRRHAGQAVTVASYGRHSREIVKKAQYLGKDWIRPVKDQTRHQVEDTGDKKANLEEVLKTSMAKATLDLKARYNKSYLEQIGDSHFRYDPKAKTSEEKIKSNSVQKGVRSLEHSRGNVMFDQNEEAESDSSDQVDPDRSLWKSDYMRDQSVHMEARKDGLDPVLKLLDVQLLANGSENKGQVADAHSIEYDLPEESNMPSTKKKRKGKVDLIDQDDLYESAYLQSKQAMQIEHSDRTRKKGKWNADTQTASLATVPPDSLILEKGTTSIEREEEPVKKPFTLITPTIHTGFSFSIVHLLSAVRKAMVTSPIEDTIELHNHLKKEDGMNELEREARNKAFEMVNGTHQSQSSENMDADSSDDARQKNLPSLTVHEIVDRVRLNPGDPCLLETQEPLHDLVRGALKIFSSKTAPLGAKGWKALVLYEKSNKSWSWVGPVSSSLFGNDSFEEETSSESWGIPHKMLVKLVDAFANWLKSGQEILKQIGSLPTLPITMLQNLDEKERFRDLKTQKCPNTISPSFDQARSYFRREEVLRYSIPDRAFSYTAADGKKTTVAPLRRGGGKPTSKARDHFMLKIDRPPHVTILCLVRDAAARLPGSIGTRADVSTLIRDSQYISEEVSDAQINQVISGALDRLHYERDPCVQFDNDKKLWVYLHRDREEEDFEDDGTSSTKKWKKPRKDTMPHSDTRVVSDVHLHGDGDTALVGYSAEYDLNPDPCVGSASIHVGQKNEPVYNDPRHNIDNVGSFIDSTTGRKSQGIPVINQALRSNPFRENKMLCQENSTMEDFDDEQFGRERPVRHFSESLFGRLDDSWA